MPLDTALTIALRFTGFSMIVLGFAHAVLPRLLNWQKDLSNLTTINRQIFIVHCFFLAVGIFLLGLVCLFFADTLVSKSMLALVASACFTMCWLSRLLCQIFLFTREVTPNKRWNSRLNLAGTALWLFYTSVFAILWAYQGGLIGK